MPDNPAGTPVAKIELKQSCDVSVCSVLMRIELNCAMCGNNRFALDGEIADDCHVECADCGHKIGTMAELKQRVAAEVLKRSISRDAERETESPPLIR